VIHRDIELRASGNLYKQVQQVREYLNVSLESQLAWSGKDEALLGWRHAIEAVGVFVFKRPFKQFDVSGFCILGDEFPLIYVNSGTAKTRQIFTMIHELAHLLLNVAGITKRDDSFVDNLRGRERQVEVFCNRFTAELLLPSAAFDALLKEKNWGLEDIDDIASSFHVSREVVLRVFLGRGEITPQEYRKKSDQYLEQFLEGRAKQKGGNYYATKMTYLGKSFLDLAFSKYYKGRITMEQLADYLSVKVSNVPTLEQYLLSKE
jgi:Zn-dependent peptidase ImmA (M78 family)